MSCLNNSLGVEKADQKTWIKDKIIQLFDEMNSLADKQDGERRDRYKRLKQTVGKAAVLTIPSLRKKC